MSIKHPIDTETEPNSVETDLLADDTVRFKTGNTGEWITADLVIHTSDAR